MTNFDQIFEDFNKANPDDAKDYQIGEAKLPPEGATLKIVSGGWTPESIGDLQCPGCGECYLHQCRVVIRFRKEDAGGKIVTVDDDVKIEHVEASSFPWRRSSLDVYFWCEQCSHDAVYVLQIFQHKGTTGITWSEVLQDQDPQNIPID